MRSRLASPLAKDLNDLDECVARHRRLHLFLRRRELLLLRAADGVVAMLAVLVALLAVPDGGLVILAVVGGALAGLVGALHRHVDDDGGQRLRHRTRRLELYLPDYRGRDI